MEDNSNLTEFSSLSVGQAEMEARSNNRRMCNELVWELCEEIPIVKTSERILLTSHNIHIYLEPRFSKMRLFYGNAIAFLKAKLNAKEKVVIRINRVPRNNYPIAVINQKQSNEKFELETNHFRVHIQNTNSHSKELCSISVDVGQSSVNAHFLHFLRLIAPLLQPIQFSLNGDLSIPFDVIVHFLDTQSDWIDSIGFLDYKFNLEPIYGALSKYNKLQIGGSLRPVNVPKLVQWLTFNNNNNSGQPKKCLILDQDLLNRGLVMLKDELKKEFAAATSKSPFVVRLKLRHWLDEFTMCNELTGEKLQLRRKNVNKYGRYIHALNRIPNNGLEDDENDCAELMDTSVICLY